MNSIFPKHYERWLGARVPVRRDEPLSTCDRCAMVCPQPPTRDPGPFRADLKCCTYFPYIPNFSLYGMSIAPSGGCVLPTGLHVAPEREALARELGPGAFGNDERLLCPFYDRVQNRCGIWDRRPGVCATYFCRSTEAEDGFAFWRTVEEYVNLFEWQMANHLARALDVGDERIEMCKAALSIEEPGEEREYFVRAAWAEDFDRQGEFFTRCAELAAGMSAGEVESLLGDRGHELAELLKGSRSRNV